MKSLKLKISKIKRFISNFKLRIYKYWVYLKHKFFIPLKFCRYVSSACKQFFTWSLIKDHPVDCAFNLFRILFLSMINAIRMSSHDAFEEYEKFKALAMMKYKSGRKLSSCERAYIYSYFVSMRIRHHDVIKMTNIIYVFGVV